MLFSRPRSLNGRWVCLALSLAGAGALSASGAMDDGPSISQLTMDSNQMQVTVSYPSSQIQNRWNVYSRSVMDGADTGAWTLAGTSLVLTGGVCTSWSALLMPNQYFAMGDQGLDSDGDGLSDAYEQLVSHTDPMRADTDGDGVSDGDEVSLYGTDPLNAASHPTQTILRASGKLIVDGSGAPILLRGMNMGGWLSYEQWMVQFQPTNYATDDYTVRATLDGRFGATGTVYLLDIFRDHYFTAADLDELKAAGCNFLRVPFPANLLEDDTNTYHYMDSGWARLDWVVAGCAARHMYCLLDLHGVQGSQNPWDHSGRQNYDQLWFNTDFQNRAVAMWGAIAQRYATNAAVAGYDLMNEPYVSNTNQYLFFTNNILPLYDRMYRAIRAQDSQHLVFVQSTEQLVGSNGACWWMPNPAAIGWSNVVYEFHHYDGIIGSWDADFSYQKSIADQLIVEYADLGERYQVPIYLGEFNPIYPQNVDYFLRQFSANGIQWTPWNYKHWGEWKDPQQPWSSWGLYYRSSGSNSVLQPNLLTDSWTDLELKLSQYDNNQCSLNPHLLDVVQRATAHPDLAVPPTDFYVNTFSAHDQTNRMVPDDAWPWLKLGMAGGDDSTYVLTNHHGRLLLNWNNNIQLRLKSRPESDARFRVNDSVGCWFSVALNKMGTNNNIQLAVMRDALTNALWGSSTPGVVAQVQGRTSGQQVRLRIYAKSVGQTNTFGTLLYSSANMTLVTNRVLELYVNATNAILRYNGSNYWSGAHGVNVTSWLNGAACLLEADNSSSASAQTFVELGTIMASRSNVIWSGRFDGNFASHPDRLPFLAVPEQWSVQDLGATSTNTCFQNGRVVLVPTQQEWGITWLNPRRDFGNDLRLSASDNVACEIQATFSRYTNGCAKLCFVPEYIPRETYWLYDNPFVFAEIRDQPGGQMVFHIFRQQSVGNIVSCISNIVPYVEGQSFSFQVTSNQAAIYYGSNLVVTASHGLTNFAQVFPYGLYPHLEFQNYQNNNGPSFNNGSSCVNGVLIRPLPGFTPPD